MPLRSPSEQWCVSGTGPVAVEQGGVWQGPFGLCTGARFCPTLRLQGLRLGCDKHLAEHVEAEIASNQDVPEEDRPYGGLPSAEIVGLGSARIQLAVAEVRHISVGEISADQAVKARDTVGREGLDLIHVEPIQRQEVAITVDPAGGPVPQTSTTGGWALSDERRTLAVNLFPDLAFVQTSTYSRYRESLRPALSGVVAALAEVFAPDLLQRIGLRYVNRFDDRTVRSAADWQGKIAASFLGVPADGLLGSLAQTTQQQVELALEPGVGALVRHGAFLDPASPGSYAYLVDLDVFRQVTDVFDPDAALAVARRLNRTALTLFQHIVQHTYRQTMDPSPLDRSGEEEPSA